MMSKSVHFSATEYPTAWKSCGVENIKIFHNNQFHDLGKDVRFRYVLFESGDDCQYGTPRLVITFPYNQIKSGLTLASGFNVLDEKKSKAAAQRFQEAFKKAVPKDEPNPAEIYINAHFGYPYAYFEREKEPGTVYVVTSKSEMGVTMALYELKGNTLKYIGVAEFPACGS